MKLIDADALVEAMTKFSDATGEDVTHGIFYTHIAPTIDAVPVIRCKDCKHYYALNEVRGNCSEYNFIEKISLDYCSWAERKEE